MNDKKPHIRICKWEELQHYKDRDPPWIKLYNRLLDNHRWGRLPDASKGHYTGLLMLASRTGNEIPLDVDWIAGRIASNQPLDLAPLVNAGLIEVYHRDSEPLSQDAINSQALARSREERREEAEERREDSEGSLPNGRSPSRRSEDESEGDGAERWMHDIWHQELGIEGHPIKFTDKRKKKYRKLYEEHLADAPRPRVAYRAILRRVQESDHHMSERSYQMPESLFVNEERREQWVQRTVEWLRRGGKTGKKARQREKLADEIEARRSR